ncbi:hypothetical protein AVEN_139477-1 [Araneus ventricosus]|uniref:Uncharacterized protein n=1 Tax=Araneus ventricosus TaxID=182803 RepID=A0A4Y2PBX9_ARAVE|nr:hypothetical protein AVEN_139477-1 [Araneus ventricosus]
MKLVLISSLLINERFSPPVLEGEEEPESVLETGSARHAGGVAAARAGPLQHGRTLSDRHVPRGDLPCAGSRRSGGRRILRYAALFIKDPLSIHFKIALN